MKIFHFKSYFYITPLTHTGLNTSHFYFRAAMPPKILPVAPVYGPDYGPAVDYGPSVLDYGSAPLNVGSEYSWEEATDGSLNRIYPAYNDKRQYYPYQMM